jgi:hypothetical protein
MISRLQLNLKRLSSTPFTTATITETSPTLHVSPAKQQKRTGAKKNDWDMDSDFDFDSSHQRSTFLSFGNLGEEVTGWSVSTTENGEGGSEADTDAFELTEVSRSGT